MTFERLTWPIRTERLSIRPATPADADAVFAYRRLDEVTRWMTSVVRDRDEWEKRVNDPHWLECTLLVEREGRVVGDLLLALADPWAQAEVREQAQGTQAEIGWCLAPEAQGHGYATEAVAALIAVAFGPLGLRRLVANAFAANAGSIAIMERLGMRRETYAVRDCLHRSGEWLDGVGYALLADEWAGR